MSDEYKCIDRLIGIQTEKLDCERKGKSWRTAEDQPQDPQAERTVRTSERTQRSGEGHAAMINGL